MDFRLGTDHVGFLGDILGDILRDLAELHPKLWLERKTFLVETKALVLR